MSFEYENKIIEFTIVHSKRKTLGIKIDENCKITVSAPFRVSEEIIIKAVKDKVRWIVEKQDEIRKRNTKKVDRKAIEGSTFMYLDKEYPLHLVFDAMRKNIIVELNNENFNKSKSNRLFIDKTYVTSSINTLEECKNIFISKEQLANKFIIHTNTRDEEKIKLALEKWYRQRTMEIVKERIQYYAENFKDKVSNIKVKEQKRRWASCTGKNEILFNWRISMAGLDVIDYIVVHEMCHMDHRNHSREFWSRVKEVMPDYEEKHEWLKLNGMNLYI
nr:SprT family zinc-dependent metalloprotease [Clostridium saccharobutylicum]